MANSNVCFGNVSTKACGIYGITSPSGKIYIGQARKIRKRWSEHRFPKNTYLQNSFNKHGFEQHLFNVLHELPSDVSQEVLDVYECFYIEQYREVGFHLLNLKEGGIAGKQSEEVKKKMSEILLGNQRWLGRKHTEETKKLMGEKSKGNQHWLGKKHTPETIELMKIARAEYVITEETKTKISETLKGRQPSPLAAIRAKEVNTGRKMTPEATAKKVLSYKSNPKNKDIVRPKHTDEAKAKMSASMAASWAKRKAEKFLSQSKQ